MRTRPPWQGVRRELALQKQLLAQSEATVLDLRRRLDQATEECNWLSLVLTSQLPAPQPARKGWWVVGNKRRQE